MLGDYLQQRKVGQNGEVPASQADASVLTGHCVPLLTHYQTAFFCAFCIRHRIAQELSADHIGGSTHSPCPDELRAGAEQRVAPLHVNGGDAVELNAFKQGARQAADLQGASRLPIATRPCCFRGLFGRPYLGLKEFCGPSLAVSEVLNVLKPVYGCLQC